MYVPLAHRLAIGVCRTTLHDKLTLFVQQLNTQPVQNRVRVRHDGESSDAMACSSTKSKRHCNVERQDIAHAVCYNINPRAHVVGVYIRSRLEPKHNMNLHCAPLQHTRTPAKPRIQNVQKAANFGCIMPPCWTLHASLAAVSQHNKSNKMLHIETPRFDSEFGTLPAGILLIALVT